MRRKTLITFCFLAFFSYLINGQGTLVTKPPGFDPRPQENTDKILSTPKTWGYPYLVTTGYMLLSLLFSYLLVSYVAKRRIEEGRMRRSILLLLSLGMGVLFGLTIILMLPKAFGVQIVRYDLPNGQDVDTYNLFSSAIPSLILLVGFTFFLLVDLLARHFIAKTHMSTTRVPGISHSPAESIRIEDPERRVSYIPGGVQGTTVATDPNVVRAERVSTEPRSDRDLRGRPAIEGTKKQAVLILIRQAMYTLFTGLTVGTVFSTHSAYNILSLTIGLAISTVLLQMVDTVLLYYAGYTWRKALMWMFLLNALMWATVAAGRALASTTWNGLCIMFAAEVGVYLYLVTVHLMPAIVKGKKYDLKAAYLLTFLAGTFAMFGIRAIES